MGKCWGDIEEGVRIEVVNTDTNLTTKVYWIAEIIKLAGKSDCTCVFWCSWEYLGLKYPVQDEYKHFPDSDNIAVVANSAFLLRPGFITS